MGEQRRGHRLSPGASFQPGPSNEEAALWHELLFDGRFSVATLAVDAPSSYVGGTEWEQLVTGSAKKYGTTWLHELVLGTFAAERNNFKQADHHWAKSTALRPNVVALRNRAMVSSTSIAAAEHYEA